jgi:hypothetical protein
MNLEEAQRKKVVEWIKQGLKLSEIQNCLASELGLRLTYMEVRLLVDDLKLVPKDVEPPKTSPVFPASAAAPAAPARGQPPHPVGGAGGPKPRPGAVSVSVDQVARPGAVVSGGVSFSDGNSAEWYVDQAGRLGLVPQQAGYRPPPADLERFQTLLDAELSKLGF